MSNTANLNTVRKDYKSLSSFQSPETKLFFKNTVFLNNFQKALELKNIDTTNFYCYSSNNIVHLNVSVFFRIKKSNKLKLNIFNSKIKTFTNFKNILTDNILNYFFYNKNNIILFKIFNLNRFVNISLVKILYNKLKKFLTLLFIRRFNLFIDFLKINSLLLRGKISSHFYLIYLGLIFKFLLKRKHTVFILFLKYLFKLLISFTKINNPIKGVKFILSGRFQSKMRASVVKFIEGSVPLQTIKLNIKYSKLHVFTMYGVFGFKLWLNN